MSVVKATGDEAILSLSITGAGGIYVGVGASAGVSVLNLTTQAWIDSGASVNAKDNVVVSADDQTAETQVAGALAVGAARRRRGGCRQHIDEGHRGVDRQRCLGDRVARQDWRSWPIPAISRAPRRAIQRKTGQEVDFTTADVANGVIAASGHGPREWRRGDLRRCAARGAPGGLRDAGVYYVVSATATYVPTGGCPGGRAMIAITSAGNDWPLPTPHSVNLYVDAGVPAVSSPGFSMPDLGADHAVRRVGHRFAKRRDRDRRQHQQFPERGRRRGAWRRRRRYRRRRGGARHRHRQRISILARS